MAEMNEESALQSEDFYVPENLREALVEFYQRNSPDKLGNIDKTIEKYRGKEHVLFNKLKSIYGEDPWNATPIKAEGVDRSTIYSVLQKELDALRANLLSKEKEIVVVQAQLSDEKRKSIALEERVVVYEKQDTDWKDKEETYQRENEALRMEYEHELSLKLNASRAEAMNEVKKEYEERIAVLNKKNELLLERIKLVEKDTENAIPENEEQAKLIEELTKKNEELSAQLKEKEEECQQSQEISQLYEKEIAEKVKSYTLLEKSLEEKESENALLLRKIEMNQNQNESEAESLTTMKEGYEREKREMEEKMKQMEKEVREKEIAVKEMENQIMLLQPKEMIEDGEKDPLVTHTVSLSSTLHVMERLLSVATSTEDLPKPLTEVAVKEVQMIILSRLQSVSSILEHGIVKKEWKKDEEAHSCHNCHLPFNFTTRKHHCRCCGDVFCSKCSNKYVILKIGERKERVCEECFLVVDRLISYL